MTHDPAIWETEESFWTAGVAAYEARMHPDCVMAFPGMGLLHGEAILDTLKHAPRWDSVTMSDRQIASDGSVLVLAYKAEGQRDDAEMYRCVCTSTYAETDKGWRLIQHQQTPMDD